MEAHESVSQDSHFTVTHGAFDENYQIHNDLQSQTNKAEKKLDNDMKVYGNDHLKCHGYYLFNLITLKLKIYGCDSRDCQNLIFSTSAT